MNWLDLLIVAILAWTTFRAFSSGLIREVVTLLGLIAGIAVAGYVISMVLHTAASLLFLGPLDKLGGAVFGFVKGFLLIQVLLIAIAVFPAQTTVAKAVASSTLAPWFLKFTPIVKAALPAEFQDPLGQLMRWQGAGAGVPSLVPGPAPTAKP